jgi:hypothetical protein
MLNSNFQTAQEVRASPEPQPVCIAWLLRSPTYQVRTKLDAGTLARYQTRWESLDRSADAFPPVRVALVSGALVLVDGYHRVEAGRMAGLQEVLAVVTEASAAEARWLAAEANLTHGLPLSKKEVRNAFRVYMQSGRYRLPNTGFKSFRAIAQDLGGAVSYRTVWNWTQADFKRIAKQMSGLDPVGTGGPKGVPKVDPMVVEAIEGLARLRAAAAGVSDPEERGKLIRDTESVLTDLKAAGVYVFPEF